MHMTTALALIGINIFLEERSCRLNCFISLISYHNPCKYKEPGSFPVFSGSIEKDQWHEFQTFNKVSTKSRISISYILPPIVYNLLQ